MRRLPRQSLFHPIVFSFGVLLFASGLPIAGAFAADVTNGGQVNTIIRSQAALRRYLSTTSNHSSPLNALSDGARRRFLSTLRFNARGITGFSYDDLQRELTVSQAYNILALFGAQQDIAIIPDLRIVTNDDRQKLRAARASQKRE
jgi:hypothetical protein